ncbi:hypothetical protein DCS_05785 [Drechmeria coniospora]|uniref:Secreted protein n=1 Tax=Drechmeria coniospora TaxID=98403 RepID=A0A151GNS1_DRECN|nr:hypothetical protein DCS_05785 [Drechmeria coniospora]KYK58767.1 hypothetical protein DCS_05785 [Drechmeria coniospora]
MKWTCIAAILFLSYRGLAVVTPRNGSNAMVETVELEATPELMISSRVKNEASDTRSRYLIDHTTGVERRENLDSKPVVPVLKTPFAHTTFAGTADYNTICDNFPKAHFGGYIGGTNWLRWSWGGYIPKLGAGPAKCERESKEKSLWDYDEIADLSDRVIYKCNPMDGSKFSGQIFHPNNWNVVLQWGDCP